MNEFEEEINKLSLILNDATPEHLLLYIYKYANKTCPERQLLILEDYFCKLDSRIPADVLDKEINIIAEIFPEYDREYLRNLLEAIGSESNRLRIIAKFLINQKRNGTVKRELCEDIPEDQPSKIFKRDPAYENNGNVSSLESNSTIIYAPEEIKCENTPEVIIEAPADSNFYPCQPSTSGYQQSNRDGLQESSTNTKPEESSKSEWQNFPPDNEKDFPFNFPPSFGSCNEKVTESRVPAVGFNILDDNVDFADVDFEAPVEININEELILIEDDIENRSEAEDNTLIYPLMEMFPEACPQFVRKICRGKKCNGALDELISQMLWTDYPKRVKCNSPPTVLDPSEQLEMMKNILVDADPDYLQMQCDMLIDNPDKLKEFIERAIEKRDYPTLKDFLRKQQLSAQQRQYTTEFTIENFLEIIPKPFEYFQDPKRTINHLDYRSYHYALCYLRNKFDYLTLRLIRENFTKNNQNFLATCKVLDLIPVALQMKSKRRKCPMPEVIENIPLLQEIAFFEHKSYILTHMSAKKIEEEIERAQTKAAGLMVTCSCCFDDEVMPKDVFCCESGCTFCKSCVEKGVEVAFGEGKLDFPCLDNCTAYFSLQVLQAVLSPKMFSTIALKKQVQEVKAAGIEDLETCPFCDFATIPAREDKLFRCLNTDCMKESCRECKEPSHVPLRCDEVEKDHDVKTRTYIENKMTEALLRTCYKCGMKFIKEEGCNKMTCTCGALMCYVCGQPVKDYKHFNGLGGDKTELCPLYCDINQLHRDAVLKGAEVAKTEIGVTDSQLKINPTVDIKKHYKSKKNVTNVMPPLNPFEQFPQHEILLQQRALHQFEGIGRVRQILNRNRHYHHHHRHRRHHPHNLD